MTSSRKTALITGITGQDGSYLTELLLKKGYEVHGIIRRASVFTTDRIDHLYHDPHETDVRLRLHYGDLTDGATLRRILEEVQPEITGLVKRLNTIAARIEPEMEEISGMSRSASDLLHDLRAAIGPDGERLSDLLESAGNSLDAAAVTLQIIAGRGADLDATLGDLRETALNLKALSQILKERPFSLIRIKPEKDRRPGEGGR